MIFRLEFNSSAFENIAEEFLSESIIAAQDAMANRFATIVHNNFGYDGEDRPTPWPALSSKYATEFHDGNRIPTLKLRGDLQASIQIDEGSIEGSAVWTSNPYANAQQWGDSSVNLPARPFFPILDSGDLTPYSQAQCILAVENAVARVLASKSV